MNKRLLDNLSNSIVQGCWADIMELNLIGFWQLEPGDNPKWKLAASRRSK
jgi:hypothetical protein